MSFYVDFFMVKLDTGTWLEFTKVKLGLTKGFLLGLPESNLNEVAAQISTTLPHHVALEMTTHAPKRRVLTSVKKAHAGRPVCLPTL